MITKRLRKITVLFVTLCMISSMFISTSFAATASDISNHWAQTTIQSWLDQGFTTGYPDGSFRPDDTITRAEFMALINKSFGYTMTAPISYPDVETTKWYFNSVAIAKAAGYISGYPDGTIKPENPISREEAAAIIMRIKILEANVDAANVFTDAAKMTWSKGAVGAVADAEIMNGFPDGSFGPQNLIKRGACVVSLDKARESVLTQVKLYFPDNNAEKLHLEQRNLDVADGAIARAAALALIAGPTTNLLASIPSGTQLLNIYIQNGIAYIDFSQEFVSNHPGGSAGELMTLYSIVNTLTEFNTVNSVQILIEGEVGKTLGNIVLDKPIERREDLIQN